MKIVRNYLDGEQFNNIDKFNAYSYKNKLDFFERLCNKTNDLCSGYLIDSSFQDNFYLLALNENKLKANRLYIYKTDEDKYTCDFISEWNDKINKRVVRNIKKTIENINFVSLRISLRSLSFESN